MAIIYETALLVRQLIDLQQQWAKLEDRREYLRRPLPDWATAPLQLAGLSLSEIRCSTHQANHCGSDAELRSLEQELAQLVERIDLIEKELLSRHVHSLESIQPILELTLTRFGRLVTTDRGKDFYWDGDERVLCLLERATDDIRALLHEGHRAAV